jgi:hypothetical protein
MQKLTLFSILIFLFNIPFGYWRANVKKFSVQWALSVHVPIPFVILIRIYGNVGFGIESYVFFVTAFFLGQLTGKKLFEYFSKAHDIEQSSCLVMDLVKIKRR